MRGHGLNHIFEIVWHIPGPQKTNQKIQVLLDGPSLNVYHLIIRVLQSQKCTPIIVVTRVNFKEYITGA